MRRNPLLLIFLVLVTPAILFGQMPGSSKAPDRGLYVDSKGTAHPWEMNDAHALIWDREAYIPVGGMFCFAYLSSGQTEENWKKDIAGLDLLKKSGINDLYINPVSSSTKIPTAAWQRVIDYLDDNNFRYGIELADGPLEPFQAYLVRADAPSLAGPGPATLGAPPASQALYIVFDHAGNPVDSGARDLTSGNLALEMPSGAAKLSVVTRAPIDILNDGFGNYWDRYPDYRKRLVEKFSSIKFGPGLRFFVDPFLNEMGMRGDAPFAIPDSPGFRDELAQYLKKKYPDPNDLVREWTAADGLPGGYSQAARLVPMQHGAGYAMDPQTSRPLRCSGKVWRDISHFRDESVTRYMNDVADALKSKVDNVPVIYKWTHPHTIFTNDNPKGGFDGLGMEIYTTGDELGRIGVHVLSQVEDSNRSQWLIVTETQDTSSGAKPTMGYPSEQRMHRDLDWLRNAGAKGFYIFGFQLLPQPMWNNFELLRDPKQLVWLANYKQKLTRIPNFASTRPSILQFPAEAGTTASARIFSNGTCWIPTTRKGRSLKLPDGLDGYFFEDDPAATVLWSPGEEQKITLTIPKATQLSATSLDGAPAGELDQKGEHLSLTLGKQPIVLHGRSASQVFPSDTTRACIEKFQHMIAKAESGGLDVGACKLALDQARKIDSETNPRAAYEAIRGPMATLQQRLSYIWIEGESCTDHNFTDVVSDAACSGGRYLRIMKSADPLGPEGFRARYAFDATIESDYEIWLAGTPPAVNWVSPIFFAIDSGKPVGVTAAPQAPYHREFFWTHLGNVKLRPGRHVLTIQLAGRRKAPDTDYVLYIDALVISPSPFRPTGINRP